MLKSISLIIFVVLGVNTLFAHPKNDNDNNPILLSNGRVMNGTTTEISFENCGYFSTNDLFNTL